MIQIAQSHRQDPTITGELYDMIMGGIEKDLLLDNIAGLDKKYAAETSQERIARMDRYKKAYELFDKEFSSLVLDVKEEMKAIRRTSLKERESEEKTKDESVLNKLEHDMK